jgi:hypothetical protein
MRLMAALGGLALSLCAASSARAAGFAGSPFASYADTVLADGQDVSWRLGEHDGTVVADTSGHGREAT